MGPPTRDSRPVQGRCEDMCPESERRIRTKNKRLHYFERNGNLVKEFSRSAAGKDVLVAEELRPSHVLQKTMNYLIEEIVPRADTPWSDVYDFVNDRIQAIRQDMTVQRICDSTAMEIMEKAVRFYLLSSYILCEEPIETFDIHLNHKQLSVCLKRVIELKKETGFKCENSEEFLCIYASYNLGCIDVIQDMLNVRHCLMSHSILDDVIQMNIAYVTGNFIQVFRLLSNLSLLVRLAAHRWLTKIRHTALKVMCIAYSSQNCRFPIDALCQWLQISESHACDLCKHYGLRLSENFVVFKKSDFLNDVDPPSLFKENVLFKDFSDLSVCKIISGQEVTQ